MKKQMKAGAEHPKANTLPMEGKVPLVLAQAFLTALREGGSGEEQLDALSQLDQPSILTKLNDDSAKKAFWINCYNAFNLYWMRREPVTGLNSKRLHFFTRRLKVADWRLSLNDIEHGILRRSKIWWAKGWLRNPFPSRLERRLRLEIGDARIHFALNCGANGCPAIRFYSGEGIENELDLATDAFFATEIQEDPEGKAILVSAIFSMYSGDFGGHGGLRKWISQYRPDLPKGLPIRFRAYDWTPNLQKFEDGRGDFPKI